MFMSGNMEESFIDEILRQKKSKRNGRFNPNHDYIDRSVEEFLRDGGKINRVVIEKSDYENFINVPSDNMEAMSFLMGV